MHMNSLFAERNGKNVQMFFTVFANELANEHISFYIYAFDRHFNILIFLLIIINILFYFLALHRILCE